MKQETFFKGIDVSDESLQSRVHVIRTRRVMLDRDLAELYGVETKILNQAVKRNIGRFPSDFMLQLTDDDAFSRANVRSVTLNDLKKPLTEPNNSSRSQFVTLNRGKNMKYRPYAFTEHGIAMLSSVLNSDRAIAVNIQIMRIFIRQREMIASSLELKGKISELEREHSENFRSVFEALNLLLKDKKDAVDNRLGGKKGKMGFKTR